jgi:hypothetical protein
VEDYLPVTVGFIGAGALAGFGLGSLGDDPELPGRLGAGVWIGGALGALAAYTILETSWWWQ